MRKPTDSRIYWLCWHPESGAIVCDPFGVRRLFSTRESAEAYPPSEYGPTEGWEAYPVRVLDAESAEDTQSGEGAK